MGVYFLMQTTTALENNAWAESSLSVLLTTLFFPGKLLFILYVGVAQEAPSVIEGPFQGLWTAGTSVAPPFTGTDPTT